MALDLVIKNAWSSTARACRATAPMSASRTARPSSARNRAATIRAACPSARSTRTELIVAPGFIRDGHPSMDLAPVAWAPLGSCSCVARFTTSYGQCGLSRALCKP